MVELIHAYTDPSGVLDASTIGPAYQSLDATFTSLEALCGWRDDLLTAPCADTQACYVCQGLDPMSDAFQAVSDTTDDDSRTLSRTISGINGYLNLTRICPGFGPQPTVDEKNGTLQLVVGFTSRGIDPVFGGKLENCQIPVADEDTTLQGDVAFAFGRSFFLDQLGELEPIVRYRGTIEDSQGIHPIDSNIRISAVQGGDIAVNFDVPNVGNMVFVDGVGGRGIHAANGRFACSFDGPAEQPMRCTSLRTGETIP